MIVVRDQYGQTDLKSPRYSAFKISCFVWFRRRIVHLGYL
jgi:hypothetical protein